MSKPLSRKRVSARDRRLAAVHEAGHVTMGRHIGLNAVFAWLEEIRDPGEYDKLWIGHTEYQPPSILEKKISRKKTSCLQLLAL
jgi:hypothetical protein